MGPLELVRPNQCSSTHQSLHSVMLHESVSPTGLKSMWALCMELGVHIQQASPWQRLPWRLHGGVTESQKATYAPLRCTMNLLM